MLQEGMAVYMAACSALSVDISPGQAALKPSATKRLGCSKEGVYRRQTFPTAVISLPHVLRTWRLIVNVPEHAWPNSLIKGVCCIALATCPF